LLLAVESGTSSSAPEFFGVHIICMFLPTRHYASATAFPTVCVTRMLCMKTTKCFVKILLPPDVHIIVVFHHWGSLLNSDGFTPNRGTEYKVRNLGGFWLISRCISEMVRGIAIVAILKLSNGGTFDDLEW